MNSNNTFIKALEHCVSSDTCDGCSFENQRGSGCKYTVGDFNAIAFDFIKHQRAQIEHLRNDNHYLQDRRWQELSEVRTEAIKDFVERLKKKHLSMWYACEMTWDDIDVLAKEMTNQSLKEDEYGHWTRELIRNDNGGCIGAKMICSHCEQDNRHDEYMQYCPNCGKKMKES